MNNPYDVLGASQKDSLDVIKHKYRILASKYHPDNPVSGDEAKFKELNKAYKQICKNQVEPILKRDVWLHKSYFKIYKEV